jgi:UDP-glucose 4-epimerase
VPSWAVGRRLAPWGARVAIQVGRERAVTLTAMKILVTGGAGYIGSITAKALEEAGHVPVVLDSLLTGPQAFVRDRLFYEGDIGDRDLVRRIVEEHPDLDATIHMAARIVVPESVQEPYEYYRDNVAKSLELFDQLEQLGKPRVVFSSSGSLYAIKDSFEVREDDPLDPTSPYARTKQMIEQILEDIAAASTLRAITLRYFNPIGSDPDLESGIYAKEPSHVLGQLVMAARGQQDGFTITGTDLPTRDGTGLRDYLHVWDLARAHVAAVERFDAVLESAGAPCVVINVGRGDGVTVRELVSAFERVTGQPVPTTEAPPRPGDAVGAFANVDRARELLDWHTELSLDQAIESALAWADKRVEVLGYP